MTDFHHRDRPLNTRNYPYQNYYWIRSRIFFKESRAVNSHHNRFTGTTAKVALNEEDVRQGIRSRRRPHVFFHFFFTKITTIYLFFASIFLCSCLDNNQNSNQESLLQTNTLALGWRILHDQLHVDDFQDNHRCRLMGRWSHGGFSPRYFSLLSSLSSFLLLSPLFTHLSLSSFPISPLNLLNIEKANPIEHHEFHHKNSFYISLRHCSVVAMKRNDRRALFPVPLIIPSILSSVVAFAHAVHTNTPLSASALDGNEPTMVARLNSARFLSAADTSSPSRPYAFFTFGYLRMAVSAIDSTSCLAGFFATIKYYNENNIVPGVRFRLNVTTIPCTTVAACRSLTPEHAAVRDGFINRMNEFSAIFKPNAILASTIVDEARRHGGIPVIDPHDMRTSSHEKGSENVIHFNPSWVRQADHLFTYMMQTAQCAHSGIFHGRIADVLADEYSGQIGQIKALFANGNYASPPVLEVQTASDESFYDFFLSDSPRRQCFIILGTHELLVDTMERLMRHPKFVLDNFRFYGVSFVMADAFKIHGDPKAFSHLVYSHWLPPFKSPDLTVAFHNWYATFLDNTMPVEELHAINQTHEVHADSVLVTTYKGYMMMRTTLEVIRDALGVVGQAMLNTTANYDSYGSSSSSSSSAADVTVDFPNERPISWVLIVDSFYRHGYAIDGHAFNPLVRSCPTPPAIQMCFCNSLTANSYIFVVDQTTGHPQYLADDAAKGQRNIAAVHYPTMCGYTASSWSYPIAGLALFPSSLVNVPSSMSGSIAGTLTSLTAPTSTTTATMLLENGTVVGGNETSVVSGDPSVASKSEVEEAYELFTTVFGIETREINFAPTAPTRALRFASFDVEDNSTLSEVSNKLLHYVDTVRPFVVYGTMVSTIAVTTDVLILSSSLTTIETEDPPLTPHNEWLWNVLTLQPVVADYIHSLVAYYHQRQVQSMTMMVSSDSSGGSDSSSSSNIFLFSHVFAVASSQREAELVSMSFATFGYLLPVESVLVSTDPRAWRRFIADRLTPTTNPQFPSAVVQSPHFSPSANPPFSSPYGSSSSPSSSSSQEASTAPYVPFILAVSTTDMNGAVEAASAAAGEIIIGDHSSANANVKEVGVLGLACSMTIAYKAQMATNLSTSQTASPVVGIGGGDIIFGAFRKEWWLPSAFVGVPTELRPFVAKPQYHIASLMMQFSRQLYSQVYFDYKTSAAEVLYKMTSVAAADSSFGPFYNTTCTPQQIEANTRDRQCQCTKGLRTVFIHSMRNFHEGTESTRTYRFSWTMPTCGVVYNVYAPPPQYLLDRERASPALSAAAIAGISLAVFFILAISAGGASISFCFMSAKTRDNKFAPIDSTQPFTIVFTDIQSSTNLWARAPSAMSDAIEQHHTIIRRLVVKHRGYEVKTVGDSFMVAFKSVDDAVQFSLDVQIALYEADWSDEINATYVELMCESEAENGVVENGGAEEEELIKLFGGTDTCTNPNTVYTTVTNANSNAKSHHNNNNVSQMTYTSNDGLYYGDGGVRKASSIIGITSNYPLFHRHLHQEEAEVEGADNSLGYPHRRVVNDDNENRQLSPHSFEIPNARNIVGMKHSMSGVATHNTTTTNTVPTTGVISPSVFDPSNTVALQHLISPHRRSFSYSSPEGTTNNAVSSNDKKAPYHPSGGNHSPMSAIVNGVGAPNIHQYFGRSAASEDGPPLAINNLPLVKANAEGRPSSVLSSHVVGSFVGRSLSAADDGALSDDAVEATAGGAERRGLISPLSPSSSAYHQNPQPIRFATGAVGIMVTPQVASDITEHAAALRHRVSRVLSSSRVLIAAEASVDNVGGANVNKYDKLQPSPFSVGVKAHKAVPMGMVPPSDDEEAPSLLKMSLQTGAPPTLSQSSSSPRSLTNALNINIMPSPTSHEQQMQHQVQQAYDGRSSCDSSPVANGSKNHSNAQHFFSATSAQQQIGVCEPQGQGQPQQISLLDLGVIAAQSSPTNALELHNPNGSSLSPARHSFGFITTSAMDPNNKIDDEESKLAQLAISTASDRSLWNGLRVRIGVHYGMGDIRKDPVSLGYDYYGTVVNTAARVEGVGHGGQILITECVVSAINEDPLSASSSIVIKRKNLRATMIALGPQPLRGLDEPIKLYQIVPEGLQGRRFPALRLHVEKETEEDDGDASSLSAMDMYNNLNKGSIKDKPSKDFNSNKRHAAVAEGRAARARGGFPPSVLSDMASLERAITKLCSTRQYRTLRPEAVADRYLFLSTALGSAKEKAKRAIVEKLCDAWGLSPAVSGAASSVSSPRHGTGKSGGDTFLLGAFLAGGDSADATSTKARRAQRRHEMNVLLGLTAKISMAVNIPVTKGGQYPLSSSLFPNRSARPSTSGNLIVPAGGEGIIKVIDCHAATPSYAASVLNPHTAIRTHSTAGKRNGDQYVQPQQHQRGARTCGTVPCACEAQCQGFTQNFANLSGVSDFYFSGAYGNYNNTSSVPFGGSGTSSVPRQHQQASWRTTPRNTPPPPSAPPHQAHAPEQSFPPRIKNAIQFTTTPPTFSSHNPKPHNTNCAFEKHAEIGEAAQIGSLHRHTEEIVFDRARSPSSDGGAIGAAARPLGIKRTISEPDSVGDVNDGGVRRERENPIVKTGGMSGERFASLPNRPSSPHPSVKEVQDQQSGAFKHANCDISKLHQANNNNNNTTTFVSKTAYERESSPNLPNSSVVRSSSVTKTANNRSILLPRHQSQYSRKEDANGSCNETGYPHSLDTTR